MVKVTKILISLSDISHVRATCTKCGGAAVFELNSNVPPPENCPYCNLRWVERSGRHETWIDLISTMRLLRRTQELFLNLQFEIEEEDSPTSDTQLNSTAETTRLS